MSLPAVLQKHHKASGKSLSWLVKQLAPCGLMYSKTTVHTRLQGIAVTADDLHALSDIWGLSVDDKRELFEAAGYLVVIEAPTDQQAA